MGLYLVPDLGAGDEGAALPALWQPDGGGQAVTTFVVLGPAATKGSTVSFMARGGRIVTRADCRNLGSWTQACGWAARVSGVQLAPKGTAVQVTAVFQFVRPASAKKRVYPTVKPDTDKMLRALLDALTGVAYVDDAQVARLEGVKCYGPDERTTVTVEEL